MVERRNHPFSFTIYFYPAVDRIARTVAVRQSPGRKALFTAVGYFGMLFITVQWGKALQGPTRDGREPIPCPGVGGVTGRALCLSPSGFSGSGETSACLAVGMDTGIYITI